MALENLREQQPWIETVGVLGHNDQLGASGVDWLALVFARRFGRTADYDEPSRVLDGLAEEETNIRSVHLGGALSLSHEEKQEQTVQVALAQLVGSEETQERGHDVKAEFEKGQSVTNGSGC